MTPFRANLRATADLPLRLLAAAAASAVILSLALSSSASVAEARTQAWARDTLDDLGRAARDVLERPGTVRQLHFAAPPGLRDVRVTVEVVPPPGSALLVRVVAGERSLGVAGLCGGCALSNGSATSAVLPGWMRLDSPRPGELRAQAGVA